MVNTELMKVFSKAFSVGRSIPEGTERDNLEQIIKQYAEARKIDYTEKELDETIDYGLQQIAEITEDFTIQTKMMN